MITKKLYIGKLVTLEELKKKYYPKEKVRQIENLNRGSESDELREWSRRLNIMGHL